MKTLKELADIGVAAALPELKKATALNWCMWINKTAPGDSWNDEEPARQAFAQAVRDAVLAELVTKTDSSPKWKLPDPPEGREWHRADWTEEMLPAGYRPLMLNETPQQGDEVFRGFSAWGKQEVRELEINAESDHYHQRTTRPLPPTIKTVPLDMGDIRATDEFRVIGCKTVYVANQWDADLISLGDGSVGYIQLAGDCERRQHGSNEWKPCTKEVTV